MGIIKKSMGIAKSLGVDVDKLPEEVRDYLLDRANRKIQEEQSDREAFAAELDGFSDDDLMAFVPDVYQKNIYKIDYRRLKEEGVKLISFDIDDTITDSYRNKTRNSLHVKVTMPRDAKELFRELKLMGFKVVLLTNTKAGIAKDVCDELQADGYIARADKPETRNFEKLMTMYGVGPSQMAHVGNSMRQDIAGGNRAGVTTCLVRRAGYSLKVVKFFMKGTGLQTKGHLIRKKLLERDIWRKHHKDIKGDQYYQLGELPKYRVKQTSTQGNVAEVAVADLITKTNADKDKTYTLEELQRNIYKDNESMGMKTLRTHLGDHIVFTSVWADVSDERELEETELLEGELSGFVSTIGGYVIRNSVCLYRDDEEKEISYSQRIPAGPDEIAEYQKDDRNRLSRGEGSGFREVQVISAQYKDVASDSWTFVCLAATSVHWSESIDFICTVKYDASDPDEKEMLFVLDQYTGDSYGVAHWYRMSSDGTVTEYKEHPYDPDSYDLPWIDSDEEQDEVTVTPPQNDVTVTTPKELKKAIEEKRDRIIITGDLAKKVRRSKKIKKLSPAVLAMIGGLGAAAAAALAAAPAATVAAPGVGGAAAFAVFAATAAPAATASGLSIPTLLVISAVGLASMSLLFDEYTNIDVGPGKLIFERRRKSKDQRE